MRQSTIAALLAAAALSPCTAVQASDRYVQQVRDQLAQAERLLGGRGYATTHAERIDALREGRSDSFTFELDAEREYHVLSLCDRDCSDLDLALYDEHGNLIAEDVERDDTPVVKVTPRWTGEFELRVRMHECRSEPCAYGVAIYAQKRGSTDKLQTRL